MAQLSYHRHWSPVHLTPRHLTIVLPNQSPRTMLGRPASARAQADLLPTVPSHHPRGLKPAPPFPHAPTAIVHTTTPCPYLLRCRLHPIRANSRRSYNALTRTRSHSCPTSDGTTDTGEFSSRPAFSEVTVGRSRRANRINAQLFHRQEWSATKSHDMVALTNLDVLYAVHTTLMARVTPEEWASLGEGSRAQRRVAEAYKKRCTRMGGGWESGIRRLDWLGSKTHLVGVEIDKSNEAGENVGRLVFGRA
ncbi:hypothetical protein B0F90DRAFT_1355388 [Multifurca ochricompacta]|uniref:DUF6699 domain-containing protein n=1 Tax=Multifurca ochricompacta TaxID=376703 RepID=A0AAD4QKB1_9AGAM|nr:hypothetical protein B0F90DRAFT_1355388 [Multifurca ochricompacta]